MPDLTDLGEPQRTQQFDLFDDPDVPILIVFVRSLSAFGRQLREFRLECV